MYTVGHCIVCLLYTLFQLKFIFSFVRYKYPKKTQPTETDKVFLNYSGTLLIWSPKRWGSTVVINMIISKHLPKKILELS